MEDPAHSAIMRAEFGKSWRVWAWIQRQFTPTSLGAIGIVMTACATYIVHLRENVVEVTTRVIVLEKQVIPVLQDNSTVTTLKAKVEDHANRIDRLEKDYDVAYHESMAPPVPRKRAK